MPALDFTASPAFWGLAGAVIYGGPLFSACLFAAGSTGRSCIRCSIELLTALAIGMLAAAAAVPLALELTGREGNAWMRAFAALIGLLSNRVAPKLVDAAPEAVIDFIGRLFRRSEK